MRILRLRPDNPIEYLLNNLGEARLHTDNLAELQEELDAAHHENQRLRAIISSINPDLLLQQPVPSSESCGGGGIGVSSVQPKIEPSSDLFEELHNVEGKMLKLSMEGEEGNDLPTKSTVSEPHAPSMDQKEFSVAPSSLSDTATNANVDHSDQHPAVAPLPPLDN